MCPDPYRHKILFFVTASCYLSPSFLEASRCLEPEYSGSARSGPMAGVHWRCRTCSSRNASPYVASCWKSDWPGWLRLFAVKGDQMVVYSLLHLCPCLGVQRHLFAFKMMRTPLKQKKKKKDISFKVVSDAALLKL